MSLSSPFVGIGANAAFVAMGTTLGDYGSASRLPPCQNASRPNIHVAFSDSATECHLQIALYVCT
ncbi:MAG: hypothetical protein JWP08_2459 [Bryobacterales bacterium]|jgi:hypothetical protein|nr:hypothetical protein [Bryobacterales bacterium]